MQLPISGLVSSVLLLVVAHDINAQDKQVESKAILLIHNMGGELLYDNARPNRPVVTISIAGKELTDAVTDALGCFRELQELNLKSVTLPKNGLESLASLQKLKSLNLSA